MELENNIRNSYAQLVDHYENTVDTAGPYNTDYERPAMLELLPSDLKGLRVLDAGSAAGWYTEQLVQRGGDVTAVDLSPEMVEAVKRRVGERAEALCLSLSEPLPFADASFDLIVSSLTLHYIEDWQPTLAEFARVLKPGGMLLYSTHHPLMDVRMSQDGDYFGTELLSDHWKLQNGETVEVTFYRRPIHKIINDTVQHFVFEQLIEPQPRPSFQEKNPKGYEKLMKNPNFLIVKARKTSI